MHHSPSIDSGFPGSSFTSQDMTFVHEHLKTVCIPHETSLGLCVAGGTDHSDGPNVFIQDIFPGGDVHSVSYINNFFYLDLSFILFFPNITVFFIYIYIYIYFYISIFLYFFKSRSIV